MSSEAKPPPPVQSWSRRKKLVMLLGGLLLVWLAGAYLVMPTLWKRYTSRHPSLEDIPDITHTGSGIPGDPLNVALIGTKAEVIKIMVAAKWYPADPLTRGAARGSPDSAATLDRRPPQSGGWKPAVGAVARSGDPATAEKNGQPGPGSPFTDSLARGSPPFYIVP